MKEEIKKFSPAIYGLALICFFLPFTHISCQGEKVATFTGVQLVTGTTIEQTEMFSEGKKAKKIAPEPLAILVLFSTIAGLGLSFLKGKESTLASAIAGGAGLIFLLLLKAKIDNEVLKEGEGVLRVEYGAGFWLILLLFLFAAGLNGFLFSQLKKGTEEQATLIAPS
jgi:hypothetical protein